MHYFNSIQKRAFASKFGLMYFMLVLSVFAFGQNLNHFLSDDESLIDGFISSKIIGESIVFDSSNIKQFWTSSFVSSKDNMISVILNNSEASLKSSIPLKIQLANVDSSLDCKIHVITTTQDLSFSVTNFRNMTISTSEQEDDFLQYRVITSFFSLNGLVKDPTSADYSPDYYFNLLFSSNQSELAVIKRIVLSFSVNPQRKILFSPGSINISMKKISTNASLRSNNDSSFNVTGKWVVVCTNNSINVSRNAINASVHIKNTGNSPCRVFLGYNSFSKDGRRIFKQNFPYNNINKTLKVISSSSSSSNSQIIVDSYPEWTKGCCLALNAKDDLSDIPNFSFLDGGIIAVKKNDDNTALITLDKPLKDSLVPGSNIRVHSPPTNDYILTTYKDLKPGEETTLSSTIKKDDNCIQYSSKAFCKGVYIVQPLIYSYPLDSSNEATYQVNDFLISY